MELRVKTNPSYDIVIKKGLVRDNMVAEQLRDLRFDKVAIITDEKVAGLYLENVKTSLQNQNKEVFCFTFKEGENSKSLATVGKIYDFLCQNNFTRTDLIIALGGGVVGDTAGFAAATFLRGIALAQIPTTLLAMVDSSIGGKTGVNLKAGKNLAGSFYQPVKVLIDTSVLDTLDENDWQNGIGEMIKYAAIKDKVFFNHLLKGNLFVDIDKLILKCLKIKKDVVEKDTLDKGLRQILNFGHTLGHCIEKHSNYQISHGKAVGIGMTLITQWAEDRCFAKKGTALKLIQVLKKYNMPFEYPLGIDGLWQYALNDKKRKGKNITLVIVEEIGKYNLVDIDANKFLCDSVNVTVEPSQLKGKIKAPPSKSMAHRALFCAILSKYQTKIKNIQINDDIKATLNVAKALGKEIIHCDNSLIIKEAASGVKKNINIDCIESGTTFRFLLPILAALGQDATIYGQGRLGERPYDLLTNLLQKKGVVYDKHKLLPLKTEGRISPGEFHIAGDISSQYISGLLLALPLLNGDSEIILTSPLQSRPYVDMTLQCMRDFGVTAKKTDNGYSVKGNQKYYKRTYEVEGDFSNAAFLISSAVLDGDVEVFGLNHNSLQGDKQIIEILKKMGADIEKTQTGYRARKSFLYGITIDAKDIPDLIPALGVVMSYAKGKSVIENTQRLKLKESDRQEAVLDVLKFLGKDAKLLGHDIHINGDKNSSGGKIDGRRDHRVIMSLVVAAMKGSRIEVLDSQYVRKSYPNFFIDIKSLGGEYVIDLG